MQIFDDQQRLRENMKSLKGSAEEKKLLERYTQQLDAQETRLEALRKADPAARSAKANRARDAGQDDRRAVARREAVARQP